MSLSRNARRHTSRADRKHHFKSPYRQKLKALAVARGKAVRIKNRTEVAYKVLGINPITSALAEAKKYNGVRAMGLAHD